MRGRGQSFCYHLANAINRLTFAVMSESNLTHGKLLVLQHILKAFVFKENSGVSANIKLGNAKINCVLLI
jgi:hypothetical protein